ncbi:MAG: hypoxanthine phosphoribosyltransferase [Smithellaceae bacterium]|nr:hypoxanthine phosphoribosyltransferase [Smithellaceae bacterium]
MVREIIYTADEIKARVGELAREISAAYRDKDLLVIGVLKGAFIFMADLVRALDIPCQVDFVRLASYGTSSVSSGRVALTKEAEIPITGRHVLIVEDIIDTGLSLSFLVNNLRSCNPASLRVCAFIDKRTRRKVAFEADYVGFSMDDGFVVGYGLDYDERDRCLPCVCIIKEGTDDCSVQ